MPLDSPVPGMASMNKDMAVSRSKADVDDEAGLGNALVATAATVGVVVAGAALFVVALLPGVLIGGSAVRAPHYLRKQGRGVPWPVSPSRRQLVEAGVPLQV